MNETLNTTPEPCRYCGRDVWVDDELGLYVDDSALDWAKGKDGIDCDQNPEGAYHGHDID